MATVYGWITEAEADIYFATRVGARVFWASGAEKAAALTMAYNDLTLCDEFLFDDVASGEDPPDVYIEAQCEQALFLLQEQAAMDRRTAIQAQGVVAAGVVKETYGPGMRAGIKVIIAPRARGILRDYRKYGKGFTFDS